MNSADEGAFPLPRATPYRSRPRTIYLNFGLFFRKPILLFRLAFRYCVNFLTQKGTFQGVDIAITPYCNLHCTHCFAKAFDGADSKKEMLTPDEIENIINQAVKLGALSISFQGGEPLTRPDLIHFIKQCKPYKTYISLISNGILLNRDVVRRLKRAGLDSIQISIDSFDPAQHDDFRRKKGAFQKAFDSIEIVLSEGLHVNICTTITHENLFSPGIQKLIRFCADRKISMTLFIAQPAGNWLGQTHLLIDERDATYLDDLHGKYPFIKRDIHGVMGVRGCPAVKETLYITSYGEVIPCPFWHVELGNIRFHSLADIRARALTYPVFREYHQKCPVGEDRAFIDNHHSAIFDQNHFPVPLERYLKKCGLNEKGMMLWD